MKFTLTVAAVALVAAVAGGMLSTRGATPTRGPSRAEPVDAQWYSALPLDPDAATAALLARVPAEAARQGDALAATYIVVLAVRLVLLVAAGGLVLYSGAAARLAGLAGRVTRRLPLQDAIVGVATMALFFAFLLPLESYAGYLRFWRAGLLTASYFDWLRDFTLGWAITAGFTAIGIVAVVALIRIRPRTWPGWAALVYLTLAAIYTLIAPGYIDPLFNHLSPLPDGPAKTRILALAHANGVPVDNVYVQDASRQSVLLNAHVSGMGRAARIVLDDNTIASTPRPEVDMVMAHEIGHFVLGHDAKSVLADTVVNAAGFLLIGWALGALLGRLGPRWGIAATSSAAVVPVVWLLFTLWGVVAQPINNAVSREQEAEADLFGLNASQEPFGLAEFMMRDVDSSSLDPSPLTFWLFYTHPSPRSRVLTAMRWRAGQRGLRDVPPGAVLR